MPRFEATLRAVAARLDLPQPDRARILEEIAGDLDALRAELVARGLDGEEAERRAAEILVPSDRAIDALLSVHEPLFRSLARRFSPSRMRRAERGGLLGVTAVTLVVILNVLRHVGGLRHPSPFLWPVLVTGMTALALAGGKGLQLYLERDHAPERLRDGLPAILVASVVSVGLAGLGLLFECYRLAARMEAAPEQGAALILPWLMNTALLVGLGLITALAGGLAWFLLEQKVASVERAYGRESRLIDAVGVGRPVLGTRALTRTEMRG